MATTKQGVQRAHAHIERIRLTLGQFELLCSPKPPRDCDENVP